MKTLSRLFFIVTFLTIIACENKMKVSDSLVPKEVQDSFKTKYPSASKVEWELEKSIYEANFNIGNIEKEARFEGNGKFVDEKDKD